MGLNYFFVPPVLVYAGCTKATRVVATQYLAKVPYRNMSAKIPYRNIAAKVPYQNNAAKQHSYVKYFSWSIVAVGSAQLFLVNLPVKS